MPETPDVRSETYSVSADFLERLNTFITAPDSRQQDVFSRHIMALDDTLQFEWIIKHDLFEGVVSQLHLFNPVTWHLVVGTQRPISEPEQIFGTYDVWFNGQHYQLTVTR